jgi:hypothetical protein
MPLENNNHHPSVNLPLLPWLVASAFSMTSFIYSGIYCSAIPIDVQHLIIDESVDHLPDELCRLRSKLKQVIFPSLLLQIGDRAFDCCTALTQVSFRKGLISIGEYAFHQCFSLVDVFLPEGLQKIGMQSFSKCRALKKIKVPSTVEKIENRAFSNCYALTEVILLEGLVRIGEYAFFECSVLRVIKYPSTVETIESNAFSRCKSLIDIDLPTGLKHFSHAFSDCFALQEIEIPSIVETIGDGAFSGCTALTDARLQEGLKKVGAGSFMRATSLAKIKLPSTVTILMPCAFLDCAALSEVDLPQGLMQIAAQALMECVSLSRIKVPASVKTIGTYAFSGCLNLVSVELQPKREQTLRIDDAAFRNCKLLINIAIPPSSNLQPQERVDIREDALELCTTLEDRYGRGNESRALEERFDKFPVHEKCYHSSDTADDELQVEVESSLIEYDSSEAEWKHHLVDSFGMTPFHVLLSAATCRLDLLQVLLRTYPSFVLDWKDSLGRRAIDYLGYIWKEETRLMMEAYLQKWLIDRLSSWGANQWRSDMADRINEIISGENRDRRSICVKDAYYILQRFERVEVKAVLELALWKKDMVAFANGAPMPAVAADREGHKARCGASFVVPNVIDFLEAIESE